MTSPFPVSLSVILLKACVPVCRRSPCALKFPMFAFRDRGTSYLRGTPDVARFHAENGDPKLRQPVAQQRRRAARLEDNTRQAGVLSSAAGIVSKAVLALWISVPSLPRTQGSCSSFFASKHFHSLDKKYPSNRADVKHEWTIQIGSRLGSQSLPSKNRSNQIAPIFCL